MGGIDGIKTPYNHVKQRFQHLKAFFIHFMQFCGPWITHKNDIPKHLGQVLKLQNILVSNIFYHFLLALSLGNWASKMFEKFGLDRKIGFHNTFYTKCINVITDFIGPSIILRSVFISMLHATSDSLKQRKVGIFQQFSF